MTGTYRVGESCPKRGEEHDYSIDRTTYEKCSKCGSTRAKRAKAEGLVVRKEEATGLTAIERQALVEIDVENKLSARGWERTVGDPDPDGGLAPMAVVLALEKAGLVRVFQDTVEMPGHGRLPTSTKALLTDKGRAEMVKLMGVLA